MLFAKLHDMRQNASWKAGFMRGQRGMPFGNPWWADKVVYGLAYMEGKGVDLADVAKGTPELKKGYSK